MTKVRVDRRLNPILRIFNYFGSGMEWLTDSPEARWRDPVWLVRKETGGSLRLPPPRVPQVPAGAAKKVRYPYDIIMI